MKAHILFLGFLLAAWPAVAGGGILQGDASEPTGRFGDAISELEDLDGDGAWELLVGAPEVDATGANDGRVSLWRGGAAMTAAPWRVLAGDLNERFGFAVARVGDVNDDGRPDFAVGAPRSSVQGADRGRVYVFFGRANPPASWAPDATLECPAATSGPQFGFSVSAAGDFNGDGVDDLVAGAPYDDTVALDAGSAWIFYGSSSLTQLQAADLQLTGELAYDHFGWSVSDAPDFWRDDRSAVVVGAPANVVAVARAGKAYLFRGAASPSPGPDAVADLVLESAAAGAADNEFGFCVRGLGDWDGDGDGDVAVGIPVDDVNGLGAGRVEVFFGGSAPDATADRHANGADGGDQFGWSVADVGDTDGDGRADLLIGAPGVASEGADAGRAYLFAGGAASAGSPAALARTFLPGGPLAGAAPGDRFGACVASAGRLDGDARGDLALGAPTGNNASGALSGYVRLEGSGDGVVPALLQRWESSWADDGSVRLVCALAEPAADFAQAALWRVTTSPGGDAARALAWRAGPGDPGWPAADGEGTWLLADRPGWLPAGATLGYDLLLTRTDGTDVALAGLAGPPALPPASLELRAPAPNPFNPRTTVGFRVAAGQPATCRVYDLQGRLVASLHEGNGTGLWQTVAWDGRDGQGRPAAAGAYVIRLEGAGAALSRLALLAK